MIDEQKAVLISLAVGVIAGFASKSTGADLGLVIGIAAGYALNAAQKTVFKDKKQGWSAGNLMMPYIFTWIITWIFLFNT